MTWVCEKCKHDESPTAVRIFLTIYTALQHRCCSHATSIAQSHIAYAVNHIGGLVNALSRAVVARCSLPFLVQCFTSSGTLLLNNTGRSLSSAPSASVTRLAYDCEMGLLVKVHIEVALAEVRSGMQIGAADFTTAMLYYATRAYVEFACRVEVALHSCTPTYPSSEAQFQRTVQRRALPRRRSEETTEFCTSQHGGTQVATILARLRGGLLTHAKLLTD